MFISADIHEKEQRLVKYDIPKDVAKVALKGLVKEKQDDGSYHYYGRVKANIPRNELYAYIDEDNGFYRIFLIAMTKSDYPTNFNSVQLSMDKGLTGGIKFRDTIGRVIDLSFVELPARQLELDEFIALKFAVASEKTVVRFVGSYNYNEFILPKSQKKSIEKVIEAFDKLQPPKIEQQKIATEQDAIQK